MPNMEPSPVTCDADLEGVVGKRSAAALAKSITYLDDHCEALLARSPLLALGVHGATGARVVTVARQAASSADEARRDPKRLPLDGLDLTGSDAKGLDDGAPAAALALVPGYGETLRVNGRLRLGEAPHVEVEEAFLHCAKAIMRSQLWGDGWADAPGAGATGPGASGSCAPGPAGWDPEVAGFLRRAPFALLTSVDADGRADLSPKGDPPGLLHLLDGNRVAIADRPGNRRTDTLHNLVQHDTIGVLAFVPGRVHVAELRGTAAISTDDGLRAALEVRGKRPKVAIVIDVEAAGLRPEPAVDAAALWDPAGHLPAGDLPRASAIWADHVRRNDSPGLVARAARRLVSERALAAGVAADYRNNLY